MKVKEQVSRNSVQFEEDSIALKLWISSHLYPSLHLQMFIFRLTNISSLVSVTVEVVRTIEKDLKISLENYSTLKVCLSNFSLSLTAHLEREISTNSCFSSLYRYTKARTTTTTLWLNSSANIAMSGERDDGKSQIIVCLFLEAGNDLIYYMATHRARRGKVK